MANQTLQLQRLLQEEGVTAIVTVPVFLDRAREKIENKLRADQRLKQFAAMQRRARRLLAKKDELF